MVHTKIVFVSKSMMGKVIKIVAGVLTALDNRLTQVKEGVKGSKDQREVKRVNYQTGLASLTIRYT